MTKSELIERIAMNNPHLYITDVERLVNTVLNTMKDALADGNRVELRGFGAFGIKKRASRTARNPRNGQTVCKKNNVQYIRFTNSH
jgi:integration host factor subunit beta